MGVSSFLFGVRPPLTQETTSEQRCDIEECGGEDDEREVALQLIACRRKALDEQVAEKIARGEKRKMAERLADLFPAAEEKGNTQRNKERQ